MAVSGPTELVTGPQLRECHGCGLFQVVPAMAANMRCDCERCGTPLRATRADPTGHCLALTFASLVLFAVLWLTMLMKVSTAGIVHETGLLSGPAELVRHGLWPLAIAVAFTTALAPLGKFAGTLYVLVGLRMRTPPPNLHRIFLLSRKLGTWSMLEVLLLGVFVAYTKLGDLVTIELGPAVYALGILTIVVVWAELALDPQAVWEGIERRGQTHAPMPAVAPMEYRPGAAGCENCGLVCMPAEHDGKCPRCGSIVHERKPDAIGRTIALVIAGAVLYIPANVYPVLTVIQLGSGSPSTIMGGVEELVSSKMYPLALLVFFASVLVPLFKLLGLAAMISATKLTSSAEAAGVLLRQRTRLYFIVAWIGRWSMVDIFMESLLGALVQFGSAVTIDPGAGAMAFCAVVIVTIFAAEAFDPRLMWDAAARNAHRPALPRAAERVPALGLSSGQRPGSA
ncbi:paraquat-inducible protein A [Reyranella sp.]|uniref:paraquat-inducible protein A n=1 Tax=Reyranella sp. TaxID=1929291 RepID=UPI0011FA1647|nr:paraquat-inducible protein A [Reyranella sp.]TAJ83099.1 MAG: paraquat-inducible protein A [Reyranella sp.]